MFGVFTSVVSVQYSKANFLSDDFVCSQQGLE